MKQTYSPRATVINQCSLCGFNIMDYDEYETRHEKYYHKECIRKVREHSFELLGVCLSIYKQQEKEDFLNDTNLRDLENVLNKTT